MLHIGVDVGGTFTDLILLDDATGQLRSAKVPTTVRNQAEGFLAGIQALGVSLDTVSRIFHGMTTGTNAVLEHRGARLALVTTRGFRDALELGRGKRMVPASMFDTRFQKPKPLVPRSRRYEVGERLRHDGVVLTPLPEDELEAVCEQIAADDVEVVVVCFLNSFANPAHEQVAEGIVRRSLPNVMTTISSDVVPEFREYERFSTATLNGYIQPVMNRYLGRLESELAAAGYDRDLYIMASGGGTMTSTTARARPVNTILSGPAGGVNGAVFVAGAAGVRKLITYDMGGTSTDVCLVTDLKPSRTTESIIAGQPMKVPQIDIKTIGAGGGSIAYLDEGGVLNVGPRSAGAEPGPACYGRGGTEPTVSDANVVLGRIDPDAVLGGAIRLQPDLAVQAVEGLGQRVGVSGGVAMAEGILRISVAKMASAIREVSIERGYDPRDYTLLAFGGAGPMHVAAIAAELGIRQILVPLYPGNLSALGVLTSDVQHDYVRTLLRKLPDLRWDELQPAWDDLRAAAADRLARDGFEPERQRFTLAADLRYVGQAFELTVPWADGGSDGTIAGQRSSGIGGRDEGALASEAGSESSTVLRQPSSVVDNVGRLAARFHERYRIAYGHSDPRRTVELVNVRLTATGAIDRPALPPWSRDTTTLEDALVTRRPVYFDGQAHDAPVYDRERFPAGTRFAGPAIVDEPGATTVVPPGWTARIDELGNLFLEPGAVRSQPSASNGANGANGRHG